MKATILLAVAVQFEALVQRVVTEAWTSWFVFLEEALSLLTPTETHKFPKVRKYLGEIRAASLAESAGVKVRFDVGGIYDKH